MILLRIKSFINYGLYANGGDLDLDAGTGILGNLPATPIASHWSSVDGDINQTRLAGYRVMITSAVSSLESSGTLHIGYIQSSDNLETTQKSLSGVALATQY
jgi:hypothetical protein